MHRLFLAGLMAAACGGKSTPLPIGGSFAASDTGEPGTIADDDNPDVVCDDEWNHNEEGIATQPEVCLLWSPVSMETMSWYEAASLAEGQAGGCSGDDCPPDALGYCGTLQDLGGRSNWRLPTKAELMAAASTAPEIPDVDGRLWTRDSATGATGNAWTVDLGRPGSSMSLSKDDDGIAVRCISGSSVR